MIHDELLARIQSDYEENKHFRDQPKWKPFAALRAVVELHKPIKAEDLKNNSKISGICLACTPLSLNFYEAISYPCPTIQAIEKELK